jgi:hypothetical protein
MRCGSVLVFFMAVSMQKPFQFSYTAVYQHVLPLCWMLPSA